MTSHLSPSDRNSDPAGYLRIGELARRAGVPPETLRAWERRYALLEPSRTAGGFRLYSDADVERIHAMRAHLERGLSAAEAARVVIGSGDAVQHEPVPADAVVSLREALDAFDDAGAQAALDRLLAALSVEAVLSQVVVPALRDLGTRWETGEVTVAQEHFASALIRGRLLGLARGWDRGAGPHALLACAPGELHDLPLIMLGLALRSNGWRISFLGQDTPFESTVDAARRLSPDAVIVSVTMPGLFGPESGAADRPVVSGRLYLGGPGATPAAAVALGATLLLGDPVGAADRVAAAHLRPA
ncbi:MAG: MerR family transcriptional regulator [Gaiellaceae bacterium]